MRPNPYPFARSTNTARPVSHWRRMRIWALEACGAIGGLGNGRGCARAPGSPSPFHLRKPRRSLARERRKIPPGIRAGREGCGGPPPALEAAAARTRDSPITKRTRQPLESKRRGAAATFPAPAPGAIPVRGGEAAAAQSPRSNPRAARRSRAAQSPQCRSRRIANNFLNRINHFQPARPAAA